VSRVGFTLIELILVVFLMAFASFLVLRTPSFERSYTFKDVRGLVYPQGKLIVDENGSFVIKEGKKKRVNFVYSSFRVYNLDMTPKIFKNHLFVYEMKNKIGDSLIVKEKKVYLFKPFFIKEFKNLREVKRYFYTLNGAVRE